MTDFRGNRLTAQTDRVLSIFMDNPGHGNVHDIADMLPYILDTIEYPQHMQAEMTDQKMLLKTIPETSVHEF